MDESRGVSAQAGEALLLTSAVPPPRGPHIGLSYFWQLQWRDAAYGPGGLNVVCFRVVYKGESPKEEGEVDGRKSWRDFTVQQLDENHYQQQKCCWLIFSCGFEERLVESVLLQPACLSQSVNVRQCVSLSAWNTTGRHA